MDSHDNGGSPPSRKRKGSDSTVPIRLAKRPRSNSELQSALPTRQASATLDGLPLELRMMIVEHLEEAPAPAKGNGQGGSPRSRQYAWMKLSMSSRRDILNIRQLSRGLWDASWKSFGKLLGDLQFRVIPDDIEDLARISSIPQLTPYITHLSFGTSGFENWQHARVMDEKRGGSQSILSFLKTIASLIPASIVECIPAFRLLIKKYEVACHGQFYFMNSEYGSNTFAAALKALPRLRSIRIDSADWIGEDKTHLRGWLDQEADRALFDKIWELILPRLPKRSKAKEKASKLEPTTYSIYASHRGEATAATMRITRAIEASGTKLEELTQVWGEPEMIDAPPLRAIPLLCRFQDPANSLFHLHTLRIQVDFSTTPQCNDFDALTSLLLKSSALKHLNLTFRGPDSRMRRLHPELARDVVPLAEALLATPSELESLSVMLEGKATEQYLLDLLTTHKGSLKAVVLEQIVLVEGSWVSLLERLDEECEKLEYVKLQGVDRMGEDGEVVGWRRLGSELEALASQGTRFRVEWLKF
ncbi:uncharacterized protein BDZ99DRAFT_246494 [Mytilinidion resinicola]|uniref:Uncharacterized protein n=1 Tax=Mytilinidion resinicola TaxID=574789 RepID=A0A6A6YVH8_9PEZI|nr:uncharacterized protein BDZ99DRAFT_246494 [Mytilinidion resinicola]KAF2812952.1 hypothetical protein BDZ99DRAFT_246494 [Mytilinidion resinicola]